MNHITIVILSIAHGGRIHQPIRNVGGEIVDKAMNDRGYFYGTESSLQGLMSMASWMATPGSRMTTLDALDLAVFGFIQKYTNYGCYCWILGAEKGVIGGGMTKDHIDEACHELYLCYKCLNIDFGSEASNFNYNITLVENDDGSRELECVGGGLNPEACECDRTFAKNIAVIDQKCDEVRSDGDPSNDNSPFCVNEEFRTVSGGGTFDPDDESMDGCLKVNPFGHHSKDMCCGVYPERKPLDSMNRECCRLTKFDGNGAPFLVDQIVKTDTCEARGGEILFDSNF